jgi:hypothetical protein
MPVRWVSHASMPCHTYTLEHNHLTQFLVCEFLRPLCTTSDGRQSPDVNLTVCQRGPFRKRTLTMIYISLSLAALGLVSLAGCEVQERSHLNTASETIQVPSRPELSSRPSVAVSLSGCDTRTVAYS